MRSSLIMLVVAGGLLATTAAAAQERATIRSLADALALADQAAPQRKAWAATVSAAEAEVTQAGLLPNPELSVEAANFAGSGEYGGARSLEVTVGLAQPIELGGKRSARVEAARRGVVVAQTEAELQRLDFIQAVSEVYAEAIAAGLAVELQRERLALSEDVAKTARERFAAGKEPQIQSEKAALAQTAAGVALDKAQRDFVAVRGRLAALVGQEDIDLVVDPAWFAEIGSPPSPEVSLTESRTELAQLQAELAQKQAEVDVLRAEAVPDVTVGAGMTRYSDTKDTAFIASVSIPLPVFNRNQGAVLRARQEAERIQARSEAARLELGADLVRAREGYAAAWHEADSLSRVIVPGAERAFAAAREGYRAGRFTYLDVLDAQRTLTDAREQLHVALRGVHVQRAQLERLTAAGGGR